MTNVPAGLRVAVIDPSAYTPPYDSALCLALAEAGASPTLITRAPRATDPPLDPRVRRVELFYRGSEKLLARSGARKVGLALKGAEHLLDSVRLLRYLKRHPVDVIHVQWPSLPIFDRYLFAGLKGLAPLVLTVHDANLFHGQGSSAVQLRGWKQLLQSADHLVAHVDSTAKKLREAGIAAGQISVIPHGIFEAPPPRDGLVPVGLCAERVNLLSFGRLAGYKGFDVLVRAVERLDEQTRSKARFIIAGPPTSYSAEVKDYVAEHGLQDSVFIRDEFIPEDELQAYIRQSQVVVLPYKEIDASGVLMLCLSYDVAVVASNLPSFAEILDDDVHARLIPPNSVEALSRALAEVVNDDSLRRRLADKVIELRTTRFSWQSVARETLAMYGRLLARRAAA